MPTPSTPRVAFDDDVRRQVDRHLGEDTGVELGGLLAGRVNASGVRVVAAVPARSAVGTARSFTFTEAAWDEVSSTLRREHPDLVTVGWYHSHPGLGVHLSNHDRYICTTFFPEPWQVAFVVDPLRGASGIYSNTGSELVMSHAVSEPRRPGISRRQQVVAGGVVLAALLLFLLGYFAHDTSPSSRVTFTATYATVTMTSTVTEHGASVSLTEKFVNTGNKQVKGTITSCLPNGAVVDTFSHLQIIAPNGCLIDLAPGKTAAITGKGPAATVLSAIGPTTFEAAPGS